MPCEQGEAYACKQGVCTSVKNVNAVSQVEEAYACKHDAASDGGDCDAA